MLIYSPLLMLEESFGVVSVELFPAESLQVLFLLEDIGEDETDENGSDETDETVEQEARRRQVFDEENNANTAEEARESRLAADAREEDAHEEEAAEATGEEPKDFLEEIKQGENFPCGHEQGDAHADSTRDDAGAACHFQGLLRRCLRTPALVEVDAEGRGHGVDV